MKPTIQEQGLSTFTKPAKPGKTGKSGNSGKPGEPGKPGKVKVYKPQLFRSENDAYKNVSPHERDAIQHPLWPHSRILHQHNLLRARILAIRRTPLERI